MANKPKKFIPPPLELPLFISGKLKQPEYFNKLIKRLKSSKMYQSVCRDPCPERIPKTTPVKTLGLRPECIRKTKGTRDLITVRSWSLPPNRYNIRENPVRPEGFKSCCWSRVKRIDRTIIGHNAVRRPIGTSQMYNIQHKPFCVLCNKHKSKFGINLRALRPSSRLMNNEPATAWKDTSYPGPDKYYPRPYPKVTHIQPKAPYIYKYYNQSSVPVKDYFMPDPYQNNPGPGRYNPLIPCPNPSKNKKCFHDSDAVSRYERSKIRRFRRQKFAKVAINDVCPDPYYSQVKGHGHKYHFIEHPQKKKLHLMALEQAAAKRGKAPKPSNAVKMFCNTDYIQMIVRPERNKISEPIRGYPPKFTNVRFNTVAKTRQQKKHVTNLNVVFMSGQPRWPDQDLHAVHKSKKRQTATAEVRSQKPDVKSRVYEMPAKYIPSGDIQQRTKYFSFSDLPASKILVRLSEFKLTETKDLQEQNVDELFACHYEKNMEPI